MSKRFCEATRVQLPSMVHLTRLGYKYLGKISVDNAGTFFEPDTNIILGEFSRQFDILNPNLKGRSYEAIQLIRKELDNDDLGRGFYKILRSGEPFRLIDFEHIENNSFTFTGEFEYRNGRDDYFRPDITLFVNGLPLCFIEVKKPNNSGGMIAESNRMNDQRFPNRKFRRFINITQLMIFSNNMEYETQDTPMPVQGSFYCTASKKKAFFSCFREDNPAGLEEAPFHQNYPYLEVDAGSEKQILMDFNCPEIKATPEYQTNYSRNSPANRMITSMCGKERFLFLMHYGIAFLDYQKEEEGKMVSVFEKHIMRYQQLLASLKILEKLDEGVKSGIVWHTQGSGKTALSYHLNYILTDYFAKKNIVAKFYFIVDRLDLLEQATFEFDTARGLKVKTASTRSELMKQFKTGVSIEGYTGENQMIVVNIQRFAESNEKVEIPAYSTNLQRVFIIDEAHRGYKPTGSFLANLLESDKKSIKIALTGTPLLKEERASWKVFGNYLHTYYYDKSIEDGYTLKIIREDIETTYKEHLSEVCDKLEQLVQKKEITKEDIFSHPMYVEPLLHYILTDLVQFRRRYFNTSLKNPLPEMGGMVICANSKQAKNMFEMFYTVQRQICAEQGLKKDLKAALVLYDSCDKDALKDIIDNFRHKDDYDLLIVFNMLLTGFDAPRLKRLYLGRELKDHGLLQAVTRVNRPYGDMIHGFVIDFVDIKKNFEETNARYLQELNKFNNIDPDNPPENGTTYAEIFETKEELIRKMKVARDALYEYNTDNVEIFSKEISEIHDKKILITLRDALEVARDCTNVVRSFGDQDLVNEFARLYIDKMPDMLSVLRDRIHYINELEALNRDDSTTQTVNEALNSIEFIFHKRGTDEMNILSSTDELDGLMKKVVHLMGDYFDKEDPEYITLYEALIERFREHGFVIESETEYTVTMDYLRSLYEKMVVLENKNSNILRHYNDDSKYARMHKRIREINLRRIKNNQPLIISSSEMDIEDVLKEVKLRVDNIVYNQSSILGEEGYFEKTVMSIISNVLREKQLTIQREDKEFIKNGLINEYVKQYSSESGMGLIA